jgi:nucleoside-diphosphate-sugar epimerase
MRILVTGANGFIGGHLCSHLKKKGAFVLPLDIEDGDLSYPMAAQGLKALIKSERVEVVIHLAAQVGREFGEQDLSRTITLNALMSAHVARAAQEGGARLMYCSTSEVYGDQGMADCHEWSKMRLPHNLYGLSKRWGEEVSALYCPKGLQVIRLSMPYGPGLPAGRGRAAIINMLWQAHRRYEIPVHEGAARSWCWVGDTVAGIRVVLEKGEKAQSASGYLNGIGTYNIGGDNEVSMLEVAEMACDLAGSPKDLIRMTEAPSNQTVVKRLSNAKLRSLGWKQTVGLKEGMDRTYEYVKTLSADGSADGN